MGRAQSKIAFGRVGRPSQGAAIWITALVLLAVSAASVATGRMTHGFIAYYTAARALVSGELDARVYDDAWFMAAVQRVTGTEVKEIFGPNPPAMSLLALPVAAFEPRVARAVWLTVSLIAFSGATWFWLSRLSRHGMSGLAAIAVVMLNPAVWANLRQAQAYLLIFAAFTFAARSSLAGRDSAGGFVAGLLVSLKSSGVPWWALGAVQRRWRFVAAAVVSWLLVSGVVFAVTGPAPWLRYPRYVAEFVQRPGASATAYQTTWSLARRLCVADPQFNPAPAGNCGSAALVLPPLAVLFAWLWTARRVVRGGLPEMSVAAGVCLSLLALPVAEEHHFVLLSIPLLLLLERRALHAASRPLENAALGLAVALLLLPLEAVTRFSAGWSALAAYPRLYAAWLLWAIAVQGHADTDSS